MAETNEPLPGIQESFTDALPKIQRLARVNHWRLRGTEKEEAIAETVALVWRAYRSLALRGGDAERLLTNMVALSSKRVRCGLGVTNINPRGDVLSKVARFRQAYAVNSIPTGDEDTAPEVLDALKHTRSPADQAVLNVDVAAWMQGLDDYRRTVAEQLASGMSVADVTRTCRISQDSVGKIRRQLLVDWERFHGNAS